MPDPTVTELRGHVPTAVPDLFEDQSHLSLAIDSLGDILDALIASARAADPGFAR